MNELQKLMNDISEWSDSTFGDSQRNPAIAYHLKKEVDELIEKLVEIGDINSSYNDKLLDDTREEFADCFMLLLDSVHHFGLTALGLYKETKRKLEINKNRKWGIPDENGVVEHLEE